LINKTSYSPKLRIFHPAASILGPILWLANWGAETTNYFNQYNSMPLKKKKNNQAKYNPTRKFQLTVFFIHIYTNLGFGRLQL